MWENQSIEGGDYYNLARYNCVPQIKLISQADGGSLESQYWHGSRMVNLERECWPWTPSGGWTWLPHIVPIARLEFLRSLKFSRLESFRALQLYGQIGVF
jgi:hypothetical protein